MITKKHLEDAAKDLNSLATDLVDTGGDPEELLDQYVGVDADALSAMAKYFGLDVAKMAENSPLHDDLAAAFIVGCHTGIKAAQLAMEEENEFSS